MVENKNLIIRKLILKKSNYILKTIDMKRIKLFIILACISLTGYAKTLPVRPDQAPSSKSHTILIDVNHNQKFWNNPETMKGGDINRVKYMTGELVKSVETLDAAIGYLNEEIKPDNLKGCDVLFIHVPSSKYSEGETKAITQYLKKGGSLFMVMDEDYWSTLKLTNVNDIISPFGMHFEGMIPDSISGGHTISGTITSQALKIPYSGGRVVKGGTPFCFSNDSEGYPFG